LFFFFFFVGVRKEFLRRQDGLQVGSSSKVISEGLMVQTYKSV
jgi:hypothetical protein